MFYFLILRIDGEQRIAESEFLHHFHFLKFLFAEILPAQHYDGKAWNNIHIGKCPGCIQAYVALLSGVAYVVL